MTLIHFIISKWVNAFCVDLAYGSLTVSKLLNVLKCPAVSHDNHHLNVENINFQLEVREKISYPAVSLLHEIVFFLYSHFCCYSWPRLIWKTEWLWTLIEEVHELYMVIHGDCGSQEAEGSTCCLGSTLHWAWVRSLLVRAKWDWIKKTL